MIRRAQPEVCLGLFLPVIAFGSSALATEISGPQRGTWTLAESPYLLMGDVSVRPGRSLIIEPGVSVIAQGHYRITVEEGTFLAIGTADAPILFTADDTTTGWKGIRLLSAGDDTVITYCVIEYAKRYEQDWTEARGGALYVETCSPPVTNNVFRFNSIHADSFNGLGGAIYTLTSSSVISDNVITDNSADTGGGIVVLDFSNPVIRNNYVSGNTALRAGGGVYLGTRTSSLVEYNIIVANDAGGLGGGGISSWTGYPLYLAFPTIRNNLIAFNSTSTEGGGLYCRYDRAIITNNTIVYNTADTGGGMYVLNFPDAVPLVSNCVIWGNTASSLGPQVYLDPFNDSGVSIEYSDVQAGWPGLGNIDADPLFVGSPDPGLDGKWGTADDDYGDLRLLSSSLAINAGDPLFVAVPGETDLDGHARVLCDRVDMGTYEFGIGDYDCDRIVDLTDFANFSACMTGPQGGPYANGCEAFDFNADQDVDLTDFGGFQTLFPASNP